MLKIGVLISGGGSNLQAVIDQVHNKTGEIVVVISNKAEAYGLTRAAQAGIATEIVQDAKNRSASDFNQRMVDILMQKKVDLVVMAGYMKIVPPSFIEAFPNKIINIHPSLIPSFCGEGFYGMRVHQAVYDYGVKVTGATVHFVNEEADGGPIIAQETVALDDDDTPESIQKKVLAIEHRLLPEVVSDYCQGRISVSGRRVKRK